ncbi:cytochrome c oxidase accessory protein CcoG [Hyphomicrobium denitrificans ATCC 51888]|uniref:Cytochrome c oxidase accessory protein CcoG n=1 Tax=Hyphomicrobium denitrificans (strain ATCC 51888 / DSM 1869 / NCIMB 11706 / TK 0415) TaxID=582899 RepID=D8JPW3_HYPDA|nr:cytochrome c oxidase accessory protein CcoG [Hyphomicrobium denitrificans]ADJ23847.1 cytochrome c oxidase accessory protein CcoG [Hyphomicrobium denitrificans ATCC 51888]
MTTTSKPNKFLIGGDSAHSAPSPTTPAHSDYVSRKKIYPKLARGTFRNVKWVVMAITLGIYYIVPWLRWNRGEGLPDQAILFDFANQRLLFGPIEIWAQEFYYVTGLLVLGALSLFLVTSIAGRMWCGYACPQTVWTDLMIAVERFWQGDRNAQLRLDGQGWTFEKIWKKTVTHLSWVLISLATGGALVFYFRDAPTLGVELLHGTAPVVAYVFLGLFALTTYLLGGLAREQVCIYMCPWPRIQGAMVDHDSLLISYRDLRGEPRAAHKKGTTWDDRGDCIDCRACVAVCPMGIDIRDGSQLECIQCALCIDACNEIMDRVERPRDLIAYTTIGNLSNATTAPREGWRIIRPRTILYTIMITLVASLMGWSLLNRADFELSVIQDRNPLFVVLSDGGVRNGYTVKIANKIEHTRQFKLRFSGVPGLQPKFVEFDGIDPTIEVGPSEVRAVKVFLLLPGDKKKDLKSDAEPVKIELDEVSNGHSTSRTTTFRSPS